MLGIFDSGIGGLTVAQEVRRLAPQVDIVYFGDVANAPYGNRSTEELEILTLRAMKFLRAQGATHLVSACNSISTAVITPMLQLFGTAESTITEMVAPAAVALQPYTDKKIVVAATPATVRSGIYAEGFTKAGFNVAMVAIPHLAGLIEHRGDIAQQQRLIDHAVTEAMQYGVEILVLGCTHFPFVETLFRQALTTHGTPEVTIFNPATAVATVALQRHNNHEQGATTVFTTKITPIFRTAAQAALGKETVIQELEDVPLEALLYFTRQGEK